MYIKKINFILLIAVLIFNIEVNADTIVLKNGLTLKGAFKGGNEKTLKFETSGAIQDIAISEVKSITFSAPVKAAQPAKASQPAGAIGVAAGATELKSSSSATEIPAGTKIMIKTKDAISTAQHSTGAIVEGVLELDLMVNGAKVAPKGSVVYGTVVESIGGRRIGNQRIVVQFDHIVINGKKIPIETDPVGAEGGRGGAAKIIGASALIGSASGNAGKGAAIGAGVALLAGGKHIQIPSGSKVELTIKNAVKL